MKRALLLLLAAALVGCPSQDPDEGIYVGNPGVTTLSIGAISGATTVDAWFAAETVEFRSCDGEHTDEIDLAEGALDGDEFEIPSGPWCQVVATGAMVGIDAEVDANEEEFITLWLELDTVELTGSTTNGFSVAADESYVLEVAPPEWLDVDDLEFDLDGVADVAPGDEQHDDFAAEVLDGTALWADPDGDGEVTEEERDDGSLASPDEPDTPPGEGDDDDDDTPNCGDAAASFAGHSGSMFAALLGLGLLLGRRRRG